MEGKTPLVSAVRGRRIAVLSGHLSEWGKLYGGFIQHDIDGIAAGVARQHTEKFCATVSFMGGFKKPVEPGQDLIIWASVNRAWEHSVEVGVRIKALDRKTRKRHTVGSAYYYLVAIDPKTSELCSVPAVLPQTAVERRRFHEAKERKSSLERFV